MITRHRIVHGDARLLDRVESDSVHLVVTSPPYWQLKDYGSDEQIGFHQSYGGYIGALNDVWSECWRTLKSGCRLCINVGDQFARSVTYGRYKVISIQSEIIRHCETLGFDFMGSIIWQKVTTTNTTGGASIMGSFPFPRNGIVKLDYEHILLFKKPGRTQAPSAESKAASRMNIDEWNSFFSGHWKIPGVRQSQHLARFPEEIPSRLIRMFSFEQETVLDPFMGSGTTAVAAGKLNRHSIGYEIVREHIDLIRANLSALKESADIQVTAQESRPVPLVAVDGFDKLVDPRTQTYGSRVSAR